MKKVYKHLHCITANLLTKKFDIPVVEIVCITELDLEKYVQKYKYQLKEFLKMYVNCMDICVF